MDEFKLILLIMTLGIDALLVIISFGLVGKVSKYKVAATVALAEAVLLLAGMKLGEYLEASFLGSWAPSIGAVILMLMGLYNILDKDKTEGKNRVFGIAFIFVIIGVSIDELAVGVSIGLLGFPILFVLIVDIIKSFIYTLIGLTIGSKLKRFLNNWSAADKIAGSIVFLIGAWTFIETLFF
ncbi:manganese efflux pump MntP [Bacillus sp. SG-1]|uniref:manganese efflux pump MntP n=1 Tax=Bacillus sp. SG-1 TaxID=161544 RepID=UPI00015440F9|nr:manganese efflux pump [Bacillus sp. SG-1]EDL65403.1 hypothetical protein BSG1_11036 [Bacillus sp. SG-1]